MKGIYLVAILYVATLGVAFEKSLVTDIPSKCPAIDPENSTIHIAHESDCTKFYRCHKGQKGKAVDCPLMDDLGNRLHFNPELQVCDWPWNAGCQIDTPAPTSSSSPPSPSTESTLPPTTSTELTSPTSSSTSPTSSPSPTTESTLPPTTSTEWTSPTSSSTSPTPSPSPTTESTLPPTTSTEWTSPTSSSTSPTPSPSPTTESTLSPTTSTEWTSPTSSSTSPTPSPSPTTESTLLPTTSTEWTSPTSSSTSPTPSPSPTTESTLPPTTSTEWTSPTSSSTSPTPSPSPTTESTLPPTTSTEWTSPTSSSTPTPSQSPSTESTLETSTSTLTTITLTSSSPTSPSTPLPLTCKSDGEIHLIPHETMCDLYYYCSNGKVNPVVQKCDRNLLFNPKLRVCDYPENVICSSSTISTIPQSTITTPSSITTLSPSIMVPTQLTTPLLSPSSIPHSDDCPPPGSTKKVFLPHEYYCTRYYECLDGMKALRYCSDGLEFNRVRQICTDPAEADCSITKPPTTSTTTATKSTPTTTETPTTTTTVPDDCPPPGSTKKVFLPHEYYCTRYYECLDGMKALRYCSDGLEFNRVRQICTDPAEADCSIPKPTTSTPTKSTPTTTETPTTITTTTETPTTTTTVPNDCPPPGSTKKVFLPHEYYCTRYYECLDGMKALRYCSDGLEFNRVRQICTDPAEADCSIPKPTTSTPTKSTPTTTETPTTITTTTETPTTTTTVPDDCPPPGSTKKVFLPHEYYCTRYYECLDGMKALRYCSDGLEFNRVRQICTDPAEADCNIPKPSTATPTKSTPTETPTTKTTVTPSTEGTTKTPEKPRKNCPSKGSNEKARIAHPYQCEMYYDCVNGDKILRTCPIGKHFDYMQEVCDWIAVVNCIRPIPIFDIVIDNYDTAYALEDEAFQYNRDPSKCIGTCPEWDPEYAVFLPHEDCKKYCLCSNGIAYVMPCPEPLYFDSVEKVCKQKRDAVCGVRPFDQDNAIANNNIINENNLVRPLSDESNDKRKTFDDLDPSKCIGTCPEWDPEYAVFLPHEDCKKYCLCSNGIAYVMPCPEPLYFDSVEKVCKQKRDAVCGVRPFYQDNAIVSNNIINKNNLVRPLSDESNDKRKTFDDLDPSKCIGTCPEWDPEYAVFLPHEDCKKYCLCSNGIAYVMACPEPLYFDSVKKVCKQKRDAVCGVRPFDQDNAIVSNSIINKNNLVRPLSDESNDKRKTFDDLDPSKCIGTCPEWDPEYAVLLPHEDCKKYCLCSNGIAYVMPCPEPLYFDSVEKVCKQKRDAVCGVRSFNIALSLMK